MTAVVPAIKKWQIDDTSSGGKAGSCDIAYLLTQAVHKAFESDNEMSEVCLYKDACFV